MSDIFSTYRSGLESPACHAYAVTPSDTTDLPVACRALNVATKGTVRLTTVKGDVVSVTVLEGSAFPVRCSRIWSTGTTATGIVALY